MNGRTDTRCEIYDQLRWPDMVDKNFDTLKKLMPGHANVCDDLFCVKYYGNVVWHKQNG